MPPTRPILDLERILGAALGLIDEEGLDALSMRRLGARLGVEAMALYHYVPNKEALLGGLVERAVLAGAAEVEQSDGDWRRRLESFARQSRAALLAHPNLLPVVLSRPIRSEAALNRFARALQTLVAAGFDIVDAYCALNGLALMVLGLVAGEVNPAADPAPSPQGDEANAYEARLAELIGDRGSPQSRHQTIFDFSIAAFIEGLGRKLEPTTATGGPSTAR